MADDLTGMQRTTLRILMKARYARAGMMTAEWVRASDRVLAGDTSSSATAYRDYCYAEAKQRRAEGDQMLNELLRQAANDAQKESTAC